MNIVVSFSCSSHFISSFQAIRRSLFDIIQNKAHTIHHCSTHK